MRALAIAAAFSAACSAAPHASTTPPAAKAVLVVRCPVGDATLWVDDQPIGELARLPGGVRLGAGAHRVELRHDGHHARFAEVTLAPGERRVLELTLTETQP
jgi:hypothetical protein